MSESHNRGGCYPVLRDRPTKFTNLLWLDDDDQQVFEDSGEEILIDNALPFDDLGFAELPSSNFYVGPCGKCNTPTVGRGTPYTLVVTNPFDCILRDDDNTIITTDTDEVICVDDAF